MFALSFFVNAWRTSDKFLLQYFLFALLQAGLRHFRSRTCQIRSVAPTRGMEEFFDIIKRPGQKHTPAGMPDIFQK